MGERRGWRQRERQVLRAGVTVDESLQNKMNRGVRRMRKFKIGWNIP
jgi:hypothetical protein